MKKGKQTCKILKEIRKQIAEENDIELITSECTYQGDCLGTCPKCEAEVRYLERELEKRQRLGKAAVFAGMSIGALFATTSCESTQPTAGMPACGNDVVESDTMSKRPLAGDVVAIVPERPDPDTVIEELLMGIVPMYHIEFTFDSLDYQKYMKDRFVFPEMKHLTIVSGEIEYEFVGNEGIACKDLAEFVELTKEIKAPYCSGGEEKMLEHIAAELKNGGFTEEYAGDMEIAILVTRSGMLEQVKVVKSFDFVLDAAVVEIIKQMEWVPAQYVLKDGSMVAPFDCLCNLRTHFPLQ